MRVRILCLVSSDVTRHIRDNGVRVELFAFISTRIVLLCEILNRVPVLLGPTPHHHHHHHHPHHHHLPPTTATTLNVPPSSARDQAIWSRAQTDRQKNKHDLLSAWPRLVASERSSVNVTSQVDPPGPALSWTLPRRQCRGFPDEAQEV